MPFEPIEVNMATPDHPNRVIAKIVMIGVALICLSLSGYNAWHFFKYGDEITKYEREIAEIERSSRVRNTQSRNAPELKEEQINAIQKDADFVSRLIMLDAFPWDRLLNSIERNIPDGVVITDFSRSADNAMAKIRGETSSMMELANFMKGLDDSTAYTQVVLSELSVENQGGATDDEETSQRIIFTLENAVDMNSLMSKEGIL